jgi:hypothetical protein
VIPQKLCTKAKILAEPGSEEGLVSNKTWAQVEPLLPEEKARVPGPRPTCHVTAGAHTHTRGTGARRNRRASLGLEWRCFPYRRSIPSLDAFLERSRAGGPLSRVSSCSSSEECGRRGMPVEGAAAAWIGSEEMEQAPATLSSR